MRRRRYGLAGHPGISPWGAGLGYIDVHLLASALLTNIPLWTADKHLLAAAEALGVAYR